MKYWWEKQKEKLLWAAARALPKEVLLYAFVLVYGADGQAPSADYRIKYNFWKKKHGLK